MQAHPDSAAGLLGRGLEALGLKKKAQTEEEEIPSWHPAQEPMSEVESKSFRHRQPSGESRPSMDDEYDHDVPVAAQSAVQARLDKMGPEAQDEIRAMRAQEEETKTNPAVALGPNPIPLEDLAPGARLPADEHPIDFYIKRKGYNDILILGGSKKSGQCEYYGDVAAKVMGWDITLRKGPTKDSPPLIHIGKALRWWDKNTKVYLSDATPGKVYRRALVAANPACVQDATPGTEFSPDQVAEAECNSNFEYMSPEEQERAQQQYSANAQEDPELAAAQQQASMAAMGLGPPSAPSAPPASQAPQPTFQRSQSGSSDQSSQPGGPTMAKHDSFSSQPGFTGKVSGPLTAALKAGPSPAPSEEELRATQGTNVSRAAWLPGMGTDPALAGEHPYNSAQGRAQKMNVGLKATGQYIKGNFVQKDTVKGRAGAEPLAVLRHLHEFGGNQNVLSYNGRQYVWNWMRFLGGKHTLMDVETKEVVAVGALQFTFAWQWVTAWGFRLNGPLTITGKGKDFVDIIVASYLANLEWRKHNNKIWQIIIWTAA